MFSSSAECGDNNNLPNGHRQIVVIHYNGGAKKEESLKVITDFSFPEMEGEWSIIRMRTLKSKMYKYIKLLL